MAVLTATLGRVILGFIAVVFVSLVFKLGSFIRRRLELQKQLSQFPCPPKHWFYGHMLGKFDEEFMTKQEEWTKDYETCYQIHVGPFVRVLMLVHYETIKTITATKEPKSVEMKRLWKDWIGDGLLISSGQKWARNRRLLTPGFHFDILKPYIKIYSARTQVMMKKLKDLPRDKPIELFRPVSLLTMDTLQKCIFSLDSDCQHTGEHDEYFSAVRDVSSLTIKRVRDWKGRLLEPFGLHNWTTIGQEWNATIDKLHRYSRQVIDQRLKEVKNSDKSPRKYLDLLDILIAARDEDGQGLTYQEIQDEVDTFMFAGHDTTATGISWILYNLARHPNYQQKCRQEIDAILDKKGTNEMDWDDAHNIPYTTMCIKESMRIHPPIPKVGRLITKPHTFPDGRTVHPGTIVSLDINCLHHNPKIWDNPNTYDPMRFSPENCKDRPSHSFVPFSAGPRNCIGQNFAMNEMRVVTALMLRHFVLTTTGCPEPIREADAVLRAQNGIFVNIEPRMNIWGEMDE